MKKKNIKKRFFAYFLLSYLLLTSQTNYGQALVDNVPKTECNDLTSNELTGWGLFRIQIVNYNPDEYLSDSSIPSAVGYAVGYEGLMSIGGLNSNYIKVYDYSGFSGDTGIDSSNLIDGYATKFIRIGGNLGDSTTTGNNKHCEEVVRKYEITPENSTLNLNICAIFSNNQIEAPNSAYFKYRIIVKYNDGSFLNLPDEIANVFVNPLSSDISIFSGKKLKEINATINFNDYNIDYCKEPTVTTCFMVSDGGSNSNSNAYAYVNESCSTDLGIQLINYSSDNLCLNTPYVFQLNQNLENLLSPNDTVQWTILNNTSPIFSSNDEEITYSFTETGNYTVKFNILSECGEYNFYLNELVNDCSVLHEPVCRYCTSFSLLKNQKYVVSGWTKLMYEEGPNEYISFDPVPSYENVYIELSFLDITASLIGSFIKFEPSGEIIDGWQKIQGEIVIPNNVDDIKISLVNDNDDNISAFFDDIRVHPFNGNLKSFVYDQASQKLMAELDENNYATFYEYDKEGGLIRVKKETERGIYTIQETRSSTKKN